MKMTNLTLSTTLFDVLADYNPYSEQNMSSICWLQDHFYLSDDLGFEILTTPDISKWLLSIDSCALSADWSLPHLSDHWGSYLELYGTTNLDNVTSIGSNGLLHICFNGPLSMKSLSSIDGHGLYSSIQIKNCIMNSIADDGFRNLKTIGTLGMTNVDIYDSCPFFLHVEHIDSYAFLDCLIEGSPSVDFPACRSLGYGAFIDTLMFNVDTINAPELTSIGGCLFYGWNQYKQKMSGNENDITSFNAPKLKMIGDNAFAMTKVHQFTFLSSLERIDATAFDGILDLNGNIDLHMPNVTYLYAYGSDSAYSKTFRLPKLSVIGGNFYSSEAIKTLDFSGNENFTYLSNSFYRTTYGICDSTDIIYDDEPCLLIVNDEHFVDAVRLAGKVTCDVDIDFASIPPTVTTGNPYQAGKMTSLNGTAILNREVSSVYGYHDCHCTVIGDMCFAYCDKLRTINVSTVKNIGDNAFMYSGICDIKAPNLTAIGSNAFISCESLTSLSIPKIKSIASGSFCKCKNIQKVDMSESKYSSWSLSPNYIGDKLLEFGLDECLSIHVKCYDGTYPDSPYSPVSYPNADIQLQFLNLMVLDLADVKKFYDEEHDNFYSICLDEENKVKNVYAAYDISESISCDLSSYSLWYYNKYNLYKLDDKLTAYVPNCHDFDFSSLSTVSNYVEAVVFPSQYGQHMNLTNSLRIKLCKLKSIYLPKYIVLNDNIEILSSCLQVSISADDKDIIQYLR